MILFLDVDGVLNNTKSYNLFDEYNLNNLKQLCGALKPRIVLSSDWRRRADNMAYVRSELKFIGLDIFDVTPMRMNPIARKFEISWWLEDNDWSEGVILDDLSEEECDPQLPNLFFYQTDFNLGLTEEDVNKILEKYNV